MIRFETINAKDYYQILDIPSNAGLPEIKLAYRKLAGQFHPDKTNGDPYLTAKFHEIKEAYDILSNPLSRQAYHQHKWTNQFAGKKVQEAIPITPPNILKQLLQIEEYVHQADIFRLNHFDIVKMYEGVLTADTIARLQNFQEPETFHQIFKSILRSCNAIQLEPATAILQLSAGLEAKAPTTIHAQINTFFKAKKRTVFWEKWTPIGVLIITLLLCVGLYWFSKTG